MNSSKSIPNPKAHDFDKQEPVSSNVLTTNEPGKQLWFTSKIQGFSSFEDEIVRLSVNKTKLTSLLARNLWLFALDFD